MAGRVSAGNLGGGGLNFFFGADMPAETISGISSRFSGS